MTGVEYDQLRHIVAKVDLTTYNRVLSAERVVKDRMAMSEINERLSSVRKTFGDDGLELFRTTLVGLAKTAPMATEAVETNE
jgi:hypothetical protein